MAKQAKSKRKKVLCGILGTVAVLAVAQTVVLGVMGGIGPFGFIRENRIKNLAGNAAEYDLSLTEPLENSPLQGKNVCVLGSSVVYGAASQQQAIAEYFKARFGCNVTKEAVSGTTLVDSGDSSYIQRLKNNVDPSTSYDLFICQLSTNDATMKKPLGEISSGTELEDFDTSTVTGALEYIIVYAQTNWDCPVVFFTGSHYDSEAYDSMAARLLELKEKYGIWVLDLWDDESFNSISDEERALYMSDKIHPTKAGYRDWWGPELERQLLQYLSE